MKKVFHFVYAGACLLGMSGGLFGCKHEDTLPQTGCRLEKYVKTWDSGTSISTEQGTYQYDAEGRLTKADTVVTSRGSTSIMTTSGKFTYDAEGFLTDYNSIWTSKYTLPDGSIPTETGSLDLHFTFTQGKVTGYSSKRVNQYVTTTITGVYEYNTAGDWVKKTAKTIFTYDPQKWHEYPGYPSGSGPLESWVYDKNLLVDYIYNNGKSESHSATIQNGLIVKTTYANHYTTKAYDSQARLIKEETFTDNKLNYYFTLEWADGKPASEALPAFKGFPVIKPIVGSGLWKKYDWYGDLIYPDQAHSGVKLWGFDRVTSQLNDHGFVTAIYSEHSDISPYDGRTTLTPSTTVYTYSGCH